MVMPNNAFATYEAIGNREDLSDMIYRIDPIETPFFSACEKEKATAVNHEWQTQALAAADGTNAQLEGDDPNTNLTTPTVRLGDICQISYKVARVTGTQQAVDHAGRDNELSYQEMLKGLELKRDVETILLQNQSKLAGNDGVARKCASALSWIKTNTSKGTGGADPTTADGNSLRTDSSPQRAFNEGLLKGVLASIWTSGGKPDVVYTGSFNKQAFSMFVGRATPIENVNAQRIIASVTAYTSDFGDLKVVADRFMRQRDVLIMQTDMWAVAHISGRKMVSIVLAKTGDSDRRQLLTEYTLVARNEKSSGGVFDLTTS